MSKKYSKNYSNVGKLIIARLGTMDKTRIWLAEECGIARENISWYCHGKHSPSISTIHKLSKALNIEPIEIVDAIVADGKNKIIKFLERNGQKK